jgi:hypothetical protein
MSYPPQRLLFAALVVCTLVIGCDGKKPATGPKTPTDQRRDTDATVLAELESKQDAAHCRTVLQQLDTLDQSVSSRPEMAEAERSELATLLGLTPGEVTELGQKTFSQADANYLEECFLVRAGARSLGIDARPPLERAALGFDWVCRMVYLDERIAWPAPPWYTLQAGSGIALSRAYVILAVWRQLGLEGCLIGPASLASTASFAPDPSNPIGKRLYAPVRACGVRVGGDVFLFDPAAGGAVVGTDGKTTLTLAGAREKPELVKAVAAADEVKGWQAFLAPPLPGLARRMEWLERQNPGAAGVKLFVDVRGQRARWAAEAAGTECKVWCPERDPHSLTRVLSRYAAPEQPGRDPVVALHRLAMVPLSHIPRTTLNEEAIRLLQLAFIEHFDALRYAANSPRDALLRGQFREAIPALETVKTMFENARSRMETDTSLRKDIDTWAEIFEQLSAKVNRAKLVSPTEASFAMRELEQFRTQPRNRDIERAFVMGSAARPVGAEVAFLMAQCAQERAERTHLDASPQAAGLWQNARDWWDRFLVASAEAGSPFPAREPHARALLARSEQFIKK